MRRVVITGGAGYLGRAVLAAAPADWQCHVPVRRSATSRGISHGCDLAEVEEVRRLWRAVRPELVIHTAYGTKDGERDIWRATRNVADASAEAGAAMLHMSTDLVFDGENGPYPEESEPAPVHEYGRWKARAERHVLERLADAAVVRSSLITSFEPPDPRSAWVASGLAGEADLTLFVDEIRTPILVGDLASQIVEICSLAPAERAGIWHLAGPEALSRFAIGTLVAAALGLPTTRLKAARSPRDGSPRPRDVRLLTRRADSTLNHRARPVSEGAAAAAATLASSRGGG